MNLFERILHLLGKRPQPDRHLRLYQLMRRRGAIVWDPPDAAEARDLAVAMRRCLSCRDKERCDALFAAGDAEGHRQFCPNNSYIARLAEGGDG